MEKIPIAEETLLTRLVEVENAVSGLKDEISKIVRRQDEMQKSLDLIYADRNILEDIGGKLAELLQLFRSNREKQHETAKDLKAELHDVKLVTHTVSDNFSNLVEQVSKKKTIATTRSLLGKIKILFQRR